MKISIIIITHNNFTLKKGCIIPVIYSLLNQNFFDYEIIVVDNKSNKKDKFKLIKFLSKYPRIRLIFNEINNISIGRNIGARCALNDLLLFLDDDMLLVDPDTLSKAVNELGNHPYALSAIRLWTNKNFYSGDIFQINKKILQKVIDYAKIIEEPLPEIRNKKNTRHLLRTYIGNFGLILKSALFEVGMWDEFFSGYGCEDDALTFKLFLKFGYPKILKNIKVLHIWHKIAKKNYCQQKINCELYYEMLKENNIKFFHIGRLLYEEKKF